jgi:type IV secretion system protein VirB10
LNKLTAPDNSSKGGLGNLSTASTELVDAEYIDDRSFKILEGKFIPAVLETAISSDLPGKIRAEVSENVYSNDGRLLLIPKGSLAKGEYRSGISQGQSRIFAIWTRVDTPHGMKIKLDSPSTDTLGRAGIGGIVDSHFLQRFGASAFLSIINGAAQQQSNNDNQREAFSESFSDASGIALENSINIPPTIHVLQGERINIFVAKDLNFKKAIELIQRRHKF